MLWYCSYVSKTYNTYEYTCIFVHRVCVCACVCLNGHMCIYLKVGGGKSCSGDWVSNPHQSQGFILI